MRYRLFDGVREMIRAEKEKRPLSRRSFLLGAAELSAVILPPFIVGKAGYGVIRHRRELAAIAEEKAAIAEHEAIYGTLEHPLFRITAEQENYDFFPTFLSLAKGSEGGRILDNISKRESEIMGLEQKLPEYEKMLAEESDNSALLSEVGSISTSLFAYSMGRLGEWANLCSIGIEEDIRNLDNLITIEALHKIPVKEQEKMYGNVEDYAYRVFRELTGKEKPKGLRISMEDIPDGDVVGYHSSKKGKIGYEDRGYEMCLSTLLHELGHSIYRGFENLENGHLDKFGEIDKETANRIVIEAKACEEAAAYLFMMAGIWHIERNHPELAARIKVLVHYERIGHIEDCVEGSQEEHDLGWALADSLAEHFGSYTKAFYYLSTRNSFAEIDEGVHSKMTDQKLLFGKTFEDRLKGLSNLAERVSEKYDALYEKYRPPLLDLVVHSK